MHEKFCKWFNLLNQLMFVFNNMLQFLALHFSRLLKNFVRINLKYLLKLPEQILVTITNTNLLFNTRDRLKMINITFNSLTSDRAFSSKSISHSLKKQLSTKTVWTFDNNSSCLWSLFVLLKQALRSFLMQMRFQVQIFSLELARLMGTSFSYSYKLCFALFKPWQFGSVTPSLHIRSVNFVCRLEGLSNRGRKVSGYNSVPSVLNRGNDST